MVATINAVVERRVIRARRSWPSSERPVRVGHRRRLPGSWRSENLSCSLLTTTQRMPSAPLPFRWRQALSQNGSRSRSPALPQRRRNATSGVDHHERVCDVTPARTLPYVFLMSVKRVADKMLPVWHRHLTECQTCSANAQRMPSPASNDELMHTRPAITTPRWRRLRHALDPRSRGDESCNQTTLSG
jgi:hypothetical protein